MPGSPQPAPSVPQAWHRPGFALSSPEPPAPGPAGSALLRVSWHRWAPGTRSARTQDVRAPAPAAPGQPRGSAQPNPGLRRRRERSHLSVHDPKGPEAAGPRRRGGVRRGTGPRGAWPRARKTGGPAQLGSAAGARAGAAPGGREAATRARGGGAARREERGGRGGRAAAQRGRAHGARSLCCAAAASRLAASPAPGVG